MVYAWHLVEPGDIRREKGATGDGIYSFDPGNTFRYEFRKGVPPPFQWGYGLLSPAQ
jgi:hypothetical protein